MIRFLTLLILVPLTIVIVAFAIANRQTISVSFDPFSNPEVSTAVVTAPLFVLLFLTLFAGLIIGGIATWFTQGINRRRARHARSEADQWRDEALRLRQQPQMVAPPSRRSLVRTSW